MTEAEHNGWWIWSEEHPYISARVPKYKATSKSGMGGGSGVKVNQKMTTGE